MWCLRQVQRGLGLCCWLVRLALARSFGLRVLAGLLAVQPLLLERKSLILLALGDELREPGRGKDPGRVELAGEHRGAALERRGLLVAGDSALFLQDSPRDIFGPARL